MELVYLWVEDYKNIHKQGFNFSPRFECSYDEDTKELTIDEKKDYVNIFPDNINVTAIVGENGSGKSNILELLHEGMLSNKRYLCIINLRKELLVEGLLIKNLEIVSKSNLNIIDRINNNNNRQNLSSVYYSNYSYLLKEELKNNILRTKKIDRFNLSTHFLTDEKQYNLNQMKNIEKTIIMLKNSNVKLPVKIPIKLIITVKEREKKEDKFIYKACCLYHKVIREIINIFFKDMYIDNTHLNQEDYLKCINNLKTDDIKDYEKLFDKLYVCFKKEIKINNSSWAIYEKDFKLMKAFLKKLSTYIKNYDNKFKLSNLVIDIKDIDKEFMDLYIKLTHGELDFLNFEWYPNLSTGEENFLFKFANFYSLKINEKLIKNNLFFFIDEGEITLHPNWQKIYISYLVKFFDENFKQKIHLIITSHSPFIISDLPKENVIFLEKGKQVYPDVDTFGANIHTLLSHGFFMKDGLMGEFAKEKINKAIGYLNQKQLTKEEIDYCEYIISIIGEPIVKKQLQRMLDSKRLSKVDEIDKLTEEIELMKHRIEILRKNQ